MAGPSDRFTIEPTDPEDFGLLHFTSGTTGTPKGAVHVHEAVVAHHITGQAGPRPSPGRRLLVHGGPRLGDRDVLRDHRPPDQRRDEHRRRGRLRRRPLVRHPGEGTGHRLVHSPHGDPHADEGRGRLSPATHDLRSLRFLASVGEPLNPEAVVWGQEAFGLPFHDNWWQTETGGIMIANFAAMDIRPGSMGQPASRASRPRSFRRHGDGQRGGHRGAGRPGRARAPAGMAVHVPGYWEEPERYRKCFAGGFYLTGDLARRDRDGYFWFVGRSRRRHQDLGPPDRSVRGGERADGAQGGGRGGGHRQTRPRGAGGGQGLRLAQGRLRALPELRRELSAFARTRLGAVVAPKEIEFRPTLPKNRSGKIMRRLLRAQELGLPEGDTSTLETS